MEKEVYPEGNEQRLLNDITLWALERLLKERKLLGKIPIILAIKDLRKGKINRAASVISSEAEKLVDEVSLGNTLGETWFGRKYDMEESPLQKKALFFSRLASMLRTRIIQSQSSKGEEKSPDTTLHIIRSVTDEARITKNPIDRTHYSEEQILEGLYQLKSML